VVACSVVQIEVVLPAALAEALNELSLFMEPPSSAPRPGVLSPTASSPRSASDHDCQGAAAGLSDAEAQGRPDRERDLLPRQVEVAEEGWVDLAAMSSGSDAEEQQVRGQLRMMEVALETLISSWKQQQEETSWGMHADRVGRMGHWRGWEGAMIHHDGHGIDRGALARLEQRIREVAQEMRALRERLQPLTAGPTEAKAEVNYTPCTDGATGEAKPEEPDPPYGLVGHLMRLAEEQHRELLEMQAQALTKRDPDPEPRRGAPGEWEGCLVVKCSSPSQVCSCLCSRSSPPGGHGPEELETQSGQQPRSAREPSTPSPSPASYAAHGCPSGPPSSASRDCGCRRVGGGARGSSSGPAAPIPRRTTEGPA
jgi:hypothetical protein